MPTLIASDNFDSYANLYQLENATEWDIVNGSMNVYKPASDGSVYGGSQSMVRRTDTFAADQRAECTCAALSPGSFNFVNIGVRCQSGADTRYWFQTDGSYWEVQVRIAGAGTVLASGSHSLTSGAKIALEASGAGSATRLTAQVDTGGGWTNVMGAVSLDPGSGKYIDGGTPGIGGDGGATSARGDDFYGYNLDSGGGGNRRRRLLLCGSR